MNEERKKQREHMREVWRGLDRRGKIQYVIDYYLLYIIVILFGLSLVVWFFIEKANAREPALYLAGLNAGIAGEASSELTDELYGYLELNEKQEVVWDSAQLDDYEASTRLYTLIGAGMIDAIICDETSFYALAEADTLMELDGFLEESVYQELETSGKFLLGEVSEDYGGGSFKLGITLPEDFAERYHLKASGGGRLVLCIIVNAPHPDAAKALVSFIFPGK